MAEEKQAALAPQLVALLDRAPLCAGESGEQYRQLRDLIISEINPVSISEYMLASDIVIAEWELLRLHGFKAGMVNANTFDYLFSPGMPGYRSMSEEQRWEVEGLFRDENPKARTKLKLLLAARGLPLDEIASTAFAKSIAAQAQTDQMVNSAFRRREAAYAELERRRANRQRSLGGAAPKQIEAPLIDGEAAPIAPSDPTPAA